jgi:hypothetical protein
LAEVADVNFQYVIVAVKIITPDFIKYYARVLIPGMDGVKKRCKRLNSVKVSDKLTSPRRPDDKFGSMTIQVR